MNQAIDFVQELDARAQPLDVNDIGPVLVMAPHPDDESLGCGGTIVKLQQLGYPAHVLFVSDGTMSHPHSASYPAPRLRDLRESEARNALHVLGMDADACTFMRLPDRRVPTADEPGFTDAVAGVTELLNRLKPATLLMPWQRDPHPDHRACWQIGWQAAQEATSQPRILEYLIWLWELGTPDDLPQPDTTKIWRVDIADVIRQRDQAIAAHRSQVTRLIDDDPTAFYLSPELLTHFAPPRELFVERHTKYLID